MTPMFQQCLLPYFTKWVRLVILCYWALDFIYLTLIRAGLNQPDSNENRLTAIT